MSGFERRTASVGTDIAHSRCMAKPRFSHHCPLCALHLSALLVLTTASDAWAQRPDSTTRLPAVRISPSGPADLSITAGATSVVGPDILRERAPLSVMDALRTIPGIQVADEDPFGLNLNVSFRGMPPRRSARALLLEDGVPILLGPYGDPSMHYAPPVESLERIEVVKGSSQVVNGPQTLGGVINFVTRAPSSRARSFELTAGGGGEGFRNLSGRLGAGAASGAAISLDVAWREGPGVRLEQAHQLRNILLKGVVPVAARHTLMLKLTSWQERSSISETGLTQDEYEASPYSLPFAAPGRFHVRRHAAQAVLDSRLGPVRMTTNVFLSSTARTSWRQSGESGERLDAADYAEDFGCEPSALSYTQCGNQGRPRDYRVAGIEPRVLFAIGGARRGITLEGGARLLTEGARRRQYSGSTPMARTPEAELTRDNHIGTQALAAFALAQVRRGALTITPALRAERVTQVAENRFPGSEARLDQSYLQLLPGIGATIEATTRVTLFAGSHRGFAPPRPADVYRPEPGQPIVLVDPETAWTHELGARATPTDGIHADLTLFRVDFGNEVVEAPAASGQRFVNGGRATHRGVELGATLSLGTLLQSRDDLVLAGALTVLPVARFEAGDTRVELVGNRVPYAPRELASASATYRHRSGWSAGISAEHTGPQFSDVENTRTPDADGQSGTLGAYTVAHAFAGWSPSGSTVHLRASVRNLFDRTYITQRNEGIYTGMRRLVRAELNWTP